MNSTRDHDQTLAVSLSRHTLVTHKMWENIINGKNIYIYIYGFQNSIYNNKWAAKFSRIIHFLFFKIQNNKEVKISP